jgi:hypothetical protein
MYIRPTQCCFTRTGSGSACSNERYGLIGVTGGAEESYEWRQGIGIPVDSVVPRLVWRKLFVRIAYLQGPHVWKGPQFDQL